MLREFLYRRDDLVSQFLEQIEGGGFDEEQVMERTQSGSGVGGSVGAGGAKLSAERRKHGEREAAHTLRQTPASRFNRMHQLLSEGGAIQPLEALDDTIWDQLSRNEVVEIEAVCNLAPGVSELANLGAIAGAGPLIDIFKSLPPSMWPDNFNPDEAEKMSQQLPIVQGFVAHFANAAVPCTFQPLGSPRYRFFAELPRGHLLVEPAALQGEVTVLAKIQRLIKKGAPETVGAGVLQGAPVNREQRRKQKSNPPFTVRLSYPSAVVTAVAIYR